MVVCVWEGEGEREEREREREGGEGGKWGGDYCEAS